MLQACQNFKGKRVISFPINETDEQEQNKSLNLKEISISPEH